MEVTENARSASPPAVSSERFTEKVPCPLCGSGEFRILAPMRYPENLPEAELLKIYHSSSDRTLMDQVVECGSCELIYLNPRVRSEIILDSYTNAVDPTFVKQNELRIRTFSRSLKSLMRRHSITPSREKRVLDIGCAGGAFPKAASDLGFTAVGIEPSAWLCDFGRKTYGLDLRAGTLADHRFDDKSFSVITLWDVIEHLTDPKEVLREARRILRDDGLLVINYPDYASYARKIFGKSWPFFLSVHLTYFTPKTITALMKSTGFEVEEISPFWQTLEAGYVAKRASAYFSPFKLAEKTLSAVGLAGIPMTYNLGQSMAVARKRV